MKVAFLTPDIDPGYGWARYALDLSRALANQGVEVIALTQHDAQVPAGVSKWVDVRPVLPRLVPASRGFLARSLVAVPRVRRALNDADLVHVIAEPYASLAALAAGNRPLVVTAHGTYVPQTARRRGVGALYRWAYGRSHLIAVSHYTASQVRAVLPGAQLTVIHNGVHVDRFADEVPVSTKRGPTILASGGVKARKGTHLLVEALPRVRDAVPDVQLVVTGRKDDAAYLAEVEDRAAALGVADHVHLVGLIPERDLIGWYQHADVFALPSLSVGDKFEGFGLVFLEAGACGLPVVGTTGSGVEEAVIDGETGLLVPQYDVPALASALTRLLTDEALRERMGAAGREHARSQDWPVVAGRVKALYSQILP